MRDKDFWRRDGRTQKVIGLLADTGDLGPSGSALLLSFLLLTRA
jgi:hypothetical protein